MPSPFETALSTSDTASHRWSEATPLGPWRWNRQTNPAVFNWCRKYRFPDGTTVWRMRSTLTS